MNHTPESVAAANLQKAMASIRTFERNSGDKTVVYNTNAVFWILSYIEMLAKYGMEMDADKIDKSILGCKLVERDGLIIVEPNVYEVKA